jgi:hypothetical protein
MMLQLVFIYFLELDMIIKVNFLANLMTSDNILQYFCSNFLN